jgi:RHS repeat-associated protein
MHHSFTAAPCRTTIATNPAVRRYRYHDPVIGRFTSFDSFEAEASEPTHLHKYNYGGNDPVNNVDPDGHDFFSLGVQIVKAGIDASLRGISSVAGFLIRRAAITMVRTQVVAYQAGLRIGVTVASGTGATLKIADRVLAQLRDPRLSTWANQLTPSMLRQLAANPLAERVVDLRNASNIVIFQRLPAMSQNVYFRIVMAANEPDKIISIGVIRANQVANRIATGDFIRLP